jgi:DNA/RNA endonuclease G (NUC1)
MIKLIKVLVFVFVLAVNSSAQLKIYTHNNLIINHGDMVLYLSDDTCTLISKHTIKYSNFKKLDSDRDNNWFQDTYKGKYNKEAYLYSGYDLGHLTPSHITSYDDVLNHNSFSLFNQAPQTPSFNRGKWVKLEKMVETMIGSSKSDAIIITGVIYDELNLDYLNKSKIKVPVAFFKILSIENNNHYWIGSNNNGNVIEISLEELNEIFIINDMNVFIK